jgi:hypothetical protein
MSPSRLMLSETEQRESRMWKSDALLQEDEFEEPPPEDAWQEKRKRKSSQKLNSFMAKFSSTLKGDSRFVPWEVIMGRVDGKEDGADAAASAKKVTRAVDVSAAPARGKSATAATTQAAKSSAAAAADDDDSDDDSDEDEDEDDDSDAFGDSDEDDEEIKQMRAQKAAEKAAKNPSSTAGAKGSGKGGAVAGAGAAAPVKELSKAEKKAEEAKLKKAAKEAAKKVKDAAKKDDKKLTGADKIRMDNTKKNYDELLVKVGKWIAQAKAGYTDQEAAMEFLREKLLVALPKEMSDLKKLLALASGSLTPMQSDEPSVLLMFCLLEYSFEAWKSSLATLTGDPSARGAAEVAVAAASGQPLPVMFEFEGSFLKPTVYLMPATKLEKVAEDEPQDDADGAAAAADDAKGKDKSKSKDKDGGAAGGAPKGKTVSSAAKKLAQLAADQPQVSGAMVVSTNMTARARAASNPMELAARLFQMISYVWRRYKGTLTSDHARALISYLQWLGFSDTAGDLAEQYVELAEDRTDLDPKSKKEAANMEKTAERDAADLEKQRGGTLFNMFERPKKAGAGAAAATKPTVHPLDPTRVSFERFQLQFAGPRLPRNVGSIPDERTAKFGFWPDKWQWELLNAVDAVPAQSALVIAPTSAGKSFISYYVIEKVIEYNKRCEKSVDEGVVVVVLPTKALVNQVSAVVYQKYGDVYGAYAGRQKDKVLDCQVLVTLPMELEVLLTSPGTQKWVKKIKYVVFDEVHCIGDSNEGAIWERLLTMLQVRGKWGGVQERERERERERDRERERQRQRERKSGMDECVHAQGRMQAMPKPIDSVMRECVHVHGKQRRALALMSWRWIDRPPHSRHLTCCWCALCLAPVGVRHVGWDGRGMQVPFVALSATVGNPRQFLDFLRSVQRHHNREVKLITYDQRWSDLNHYFYLPNAQQELTWLDRFTAETGKYKVMLERMRTDAKAAKHDDQFTTAERLLTAQSERERLKLPYVPVSLGVWAPQPLLGPGGLTAIHPCTAVALTGGWDAGVGFPADLPFSAPEAVALFDAMKAACIATAGVDKADLKRLRELAPELIEDTFLSKKNVRAYFKALEEELKRWSLAPVGSPLRACVATVFESFAGKVQDHIVNQPAVRKVVEEQEEEREQDRMREKQL